MAHYSEHLIRVGYSNNKKINSIRDLESAKCFDFRHDYEEAVRVGNHWDMLKLRESLVASACANADCQQREMAIERGFFVLNAAAEYRQSHGKELY